MEITHKFKQELKKMKLTAKILIPLCLLITFSIILSTIISYKSVQKIVLQLSKEQLEEKANSIKTRLNDRIDEILTETQKLSQFKDIQKASKYKGLRTKASKFLVDYASQKEYFEQITLTDITGAVIASNLEKNVKALNKSNASYFQRALNGEINISKPIKSYFSDHPVFIIAVPVTMNKTITGTLLAWIDIKILGDKFIKTLKIGETGYAYLTDSKGLVLYHKNPKHVQSLNITKHDFGVEMIKQKNGFIQYTWEGKDKIASYVSLKKVEWILSAGINMNELLVPAKKMRNLVGLIGIITITIIAFGALFIIQTLVVKPVNVVSNNLKEIAKGEGDLTKRLKIVSKDEIGQLSNWFNSFGNLF